MPHSLLLSTEPNRNWSPRHLQAMSYLYGLTTPDSEQAKILELGCGTGANLLPFALAYPDAHATGIDVDGENIAAGQMHLAQYGIKNISLYTADIVTLLESSLEQYDYILIRGLFAQTDLETRSALLSFCQKHLSPTGIICISYQTYPGSKLTDSLYEAFAFHAAQSENPAEQITGIKAMLSFMSEGISTSNPHYNQLKPTLKALENKSDEALYIESFAGLHNPCYFIEFANTLADTGLCYVGDANAHTEIPEHWGADTSKLCQTINPQKNKIFGQQYLDLLCGRSTRMSLLTHAQHNSLINFEPDTDRLMDLRWAGYFQRVETDGNSRVRAHLTIDNEMLSTENTTILDIFDALGYVYPFSLDSNHLYLNTRTAIDIIDNDHQFYNKLSESLRTIFIKKASYIHLSLNESPYDTNKNEKISLIPKSLTEKNKNERILNFWHDTFENISIDQLNKVSDLLKRNKSITTDINYSIQSINEIDRLRKFGFIIGSIIAWKNYYNESYFNLKENESIAIKRIIFLLLFNFHQLINNKFIYYNKETKSIKNLNTTWHQSNTVQITKKTLESTKDIVNAIAIDSLNINYYVYFSAMCVKLSKDINKIEPILNRVLELKPNDINAWSTLANIAIYSNNFNKSIKLNLQALKYKPNDFLLLSNLAGSYSLAGNHGEAINIYENLLIKKDIKKADVFSNYLFSLIHTDKYTPEEVFLLHKEYGDMVSRWAKKQQWNKKFHNKMISDRPLRIGFVSGDLREHAVTKFLLPYWEGLDKNKFHIYAYSNHPTHDKTSTHLQNHTAKWQNITSLSHLALAKQIHTDEIDILFDLSGHTGYNRLPAFALKPAPIQLTWIGYPATTGLEQMDYKIVALSVQNNPIFKSQFTEEFITLRSLGRSFDSSFSASVNTKNIPVLRNGYFTFASFNRPQKISQEVLKTWAEIMQKSPNDRLLIANMSDQEMIKNFTNILINNGVKAEQLLFKERVGLSEYLELHNEIDLILDTFPYNGGTTARHAISMGVPTIHIKGKTLASYTPIYRHYGLLDFQANNVKEYIEKAVSWSKKPDELLILRKEISEKFNRINTTPVQGKPNNIQAFEKMLETIFNHYLKNKKPASHTITLE